jgi:hypothetical protein
MSVPGFNLRLICVGYVVEEMALEWGFFQEFWFSPVSIIPPVLLTRCFHLSLMVCNIGN